MNLSLSPENTTVLHMQTKVKIWMNYDEIDTLQMSLKPLLYLLDLENRQLDSPSLKHTLLGYQIIQLGNQLERIANQKRFLYDTNKPYKVAFPLPVCGLMQIMIYLSRVPSLSRLKGNLECELEKYGYVFLAPEEVPEYFRFFDD